MPPPKTPVTAVLRIGQERLTAATVDRDLRVRSRRDAPMAALPQAPYPALDHHHAWRWMVAVLQDFAETFQVEAVVPTAFGGTAALVNTAGLVLPLMHPKAEPPAEVRDAFAAAAPSAELVGMTTPERGTSLALQLFWQQAAFPDAFARAERLLSHAAYWGYCLTGGGLATEGSSLADGGQLVEVPSCRPSRFAREQGFAKLMAAIREPHRLLGRLAPEVAGRADLQPTTPVLVGSSDHAAAHGLLLAASLDAAALLLADERLLLVPGTAAVDGPWRTVLSLDRRPLLEVRGVADAAMTARLLAGVGHRGPVIVAGDWHDTPALAAELETRNQATFQLEDAALWAQGAAFLAALNRRPMVPRLPLVRVSVDDCAPRGLEP